MNATGETKTCRCCRVEKVIGGFGVDRRNRDGLHSFCLACRREHAAEARLVRRDVTDASDASTPLRHAHESAQNAPVAMERDVVPGEAQTDMADSWPLPFDPAVHSPALVERRLRVIEIYRRLDAEPLATGRRGPDGLQRRVLGDGMPGGGAA